MFNWFDFKYFVAKGQPGLAKTEHFQTSFLMNQCIQEGISEATSLFDVEDGLETLARKLWRLVSLPVYPT